MVYLIDSQKFQPLFDAWRLRKARERRSSAVPPDIAFGELASNINVHIDNFRHMINSNILIDEIILINIANELKCKPQDLILRKNGLRELMANQPTKQKRPSHISKSALGWD
jgi:hypothetical protein